MKTYSSMNENLEAYISRRAGFAVMRDSYAAEAADFKRGLRAIWLRWYRRGKATQSWAEVYFYATR